MKRLLLWLPLLGFAGFALVALHGLRRPDDHIVHSAMVGKPLPAFTLPPLLADKPGLSNRDLATGKPHLLNIFASWCVPCAAEAPQLLKLKQAGVTIDAIAIRDTDTAVQGFLARNGDPYSRIGSDPASATQMALGSSGVPESFVIDGKGRILLQHVGDIRDEDVADIIAAVEKGQ